VTVDLTPAQNPVDFHFGGLTPDQLERLKAVVFEVDFQDADTLRMQLRVACGALRPAQGPRRFSYKEIGRFLGVSASTVNHQWRRGTSAPRGPGRLAVLTDVICEWISASLRKHFGGQDLITYIELLDEIQQSFKMSVELDRLPHIIARIPDIKSVAGVPYEASRVGVDPHVIQDRLPMLETEIRAVPRGFVLNKDETRCSDWADRPRELTVIVPTS
jgi:hypothetical protein